MTDREKVITGLYSCTKDDNCSKCPYFEYKMDCSWYLKHEALMLLKTQESRVMLLEDMWTLKFNDTVIIEQKIPPLVIPAIVRDNIKHDHRLEVLQVVTASTDGTANADYDYYGKTWRCWTSRPTDEQREAVAWA